MKLLDFHLLASYCYFTLILLIHLFTAALNYCFPLFFPKEKLSTTTRGSQTRDLKMLNHHLIRSGTLQMHIRLQACLSILPFSRTWCYLVAQRIITCLHSLQLYCFGNLFVFSLIHLWSVRNVFFLRYVSFSLFVHSRFFFFLIIFWAITLVFNYCFYFIFYK